MLKKRLFALALTLALCISLLPGAAAADRWNSYIEGIDFYVEDGLAYLTVQLGPNCGDKSNQGIYAILMSEEDASYYPNRSLIEALYDPAAHTADNAAGCADANAYGRGYGYYDPSDPKSDKTAAVNFTHYWAGDQIGASRGPRADALPVEGRQNYVLYVWTSVGGGTHDFVMETSVTVSDGSSVGGFAPPKRLPVGVTAQAGNDGTPVYQPAGMRFPTVTLSTEDGREVPPQCYLVTWYSDSPYMGKVLKTPAAAGDYYAVAVIRSAYKDEYLDPDPVRFTVARSTDGQADEVPYLAVDGVSVEEDVLTVSGHFDLPDEDTSLDALIRKGVEFVLVSRSELEAKLPGTAAVGTADALRGAIYDGGVKSLSALKELLSDRVSTVGGKLPSFDEEMTAWSFTVKPSAQERQLLDGDCILAFSVNDSRYVAGYLYLYTFDWGRAGDFSGGSFEAKEKPRDAGQTGEKTLITFPDTVGHWAAESISRLVLQGVLTGYPNGNFGPDDTMTRGQLAVALARLYGFDVSGTSSSFTDADGRWYGGAVEAISKTGVMQGIGNGLFAPEALLTREQLATVLVRMTKSTGTGAPFTDDAQISTWARESVYAARGAGLFEGYPDGRFGPRDTATRAMVAEVLARI